MDDAGFAAFLERAVPRRAERWARRGIWRADRALEASRQEYAELFANGRRTPNQYFVDVIDSASGTVVGEAWYQSREIGGKVEFYIQWIQIWPEHRRRGYGEELLRRLEEEARRRGAERSVLTVWTDNPEAQALYTKTGYRPSNVTMTKELGPPARPGGPGAP